MFVRQGILLQALDKEPAATSGGWHKSGRSRLSSFASRSAASQQQQLQLQLQQQLQQQTAQLQDDEHYHLTQLAQRSTGSGPLNYCHWLGAEGPGGQTKELIRQCFLFTNHLLLCTRTKEGKLRLLEVSPFPVADLSRGCGDHESGGQAVVVARRSGR